MADSDAIEALFGEDRTFPPPPISSPAPTSTTRRCTTPRRRTVEAFWAEQADALDWFEKWDTVLRVGPAVRQVVRRRHAQRQLQRLDRHVDAGKGDKVAFHWEGEPGDTRTITYAELLDEVERFANVLKNLGVQRGDRVNIYMPMIPELPVAMLACTRIGAAHSVVFGGFSSEALRDRINDAEAKVLITADGGYRRGAASGLKVNADVAVQETPTIEHVVVVRRTGQDVEWTDGRDHWWHDLMDDPSLEAHCEPEHMDSEDLLYLLYTSGTTAKPKGIMHTTGGYLTQVAFTHKYVFDLHAEDDIYWCAADIGWVTGHSYIVYGPLTNGATSVMYEGTPDFPDKDRWWSIIEKLQASRSSTARPTAIRTFMKWGDGVPGRARPLHAAPARLGRRAHQPRSVGLVLEHDRRRPLPGRRHVVADRDRRHHDLAAAGPHHAQAGLGHLPAARHRGRGRRRRRQAGRRVGGGYLTLTEPWPSMLRGIWGDPERYKETYWSRFDGPLLRRRRRQARRRGLPVVARPRRRRDERVGPPRLDDRGRVRAGRPPQRRRGGGRRRQRRDHRPGDHRLRHACRRGETGDEAHGQVLREHVAVKIGPIAKPKTIVFTDDLPKTRTGKIMRRLLRDVAEGRALGDTTTLADAGRRRRDRATCGDVADRGVSDSVHASQLALARRADRAGPRGHVRPRRRALRRRRSPALHRGPAPRLAGVLQRVR